jgi:excisionase family DNA binding protein
MIEIKIAEVAQRNNLHTAYALGKVLGISPTIAARLWKGDFTKIGINTLDKLCNLFDCQPSDLLKHRGEGVTQKSKPRLVSDTQIGNTGNAQLSNTGDMLTTHQVAARLGLKRRTVIDYIKSGKLKAVKGKGNHNFISEVDLAGFLESR